MSDDSESTPEHPAVRLYMALERAIELEKEHRDLLGAQLELAKGGALAVIEQLRADRPDNHQEQADHARRLREDLAALAKKTTWPGAEQALDAVRSLFHERAQRETSPSLRGGPVSRATDSVLPTAGPSTQVEKKGATYLTYREVDPPSSAVHVQPNADSARNPQLAPSNEQFAVAAEVLLSAAADARDEADRAENDCADPELGFNEVQQKTTRKYAAGSRQHAADLEAVAAHLDADSKRKFQVLSEHYRVPLTLYLAREEDK